MHLVARPGEISAEELALITGGEEGEYSPYAVHLPSGDPGDLEPVRSGLAAVQDEGSQLVAITLVDAPPGDAGECWLDLCAGPGGKAALLGALAGQRGASLVANEVVAHRAELVRQGVHLLDNVDVTMFDGRHGPWDAASFDRVLVDAPCTGSGALRRRPESRWRLRDLFAAPRRDNWRGGRRHIWVPRRRGGSHPTAVAPHRRHGCHVHGDSEKDQLIDVDRV